MSLEAYQQHLDQLFGVSQDERRWLATQRTLTPRLREMLQAKTDRRALLSIVVLGTTAALIAGLTAWSVAGGSLSIGVAALYGGSLLFILLLVIGVAAYGMVTNRRSLNAGVIEVRQGVLQAQQRHSNGGAICSVWVDDAGWFRIEPNVYKALAQGQPHRLYVVRGTNFAMAIEPAAPSR